MERLPTLAPCFVNRGTVANHLDMMRALDTVEGLLWTWTVDNEVIGEGQATLVKLAADAETSTLLVNGCLFLNVASFRYLTFDDEGEGRTRFELVGDGTSLVITPIDEPRPEIEASAHHLGKSEADLGSFVVLDDEGEED